MCILVNPSILTNGWMVCPENARRIKENTRTEECAFSSGHKQLDGLSRECRENKGKQKKRGMCVF